MVDNIITEFPVVVYGNLEKYNETISKGRCRVFYKYGNRNGTYITDEFADILLSSIPYAPVKGIYENDEGDYTDHGTARSQGRIYGVVPENPNVSWEKHLDEDGVERTYACVDVLIFTGLYTEANNIINKGQSMEIYPKSIKGEWKIIDGKKYFVFEQGHFLGLQVLGDRTEPCFEGAAFFSLYEDLKKLINQVEQFGLNSQNGGQTKMVNYKLSDDAKFRALWSLLNLNYNEENGWIVEYDICAVYDDYAVVRNYAEGIYERIYYTKNDETDSVSIDRREVCYIMDVSESEKKTLEAVQALNGGNYEKLDENYSAAIEGAGQVEGLNNAIGELNNTVSTLQEENSKFETKIGELNESITTLTSERDNANNQLNDANITINSLNEQIGELNSFKAGIEKKEKEAIVSKYTALLDAEIIAKYDLEQYSAKDLDKELAYELVSTNQSVFTEQGTGASYIPKDEPETGLMQLLNKYKK